MTPEQKIPDEMFDETALKSQKFLGKVITSKVQEGTIGKIAGSRVWYLEVENYSRQMTFNYSKEILPLKGINSLWTREVTAFKNNIAYPVNNDSIPRLAGKFLWFEVSDITYKDRDGVEKLVTRNFFWPIAVPSQEEINAAIAIRETAGLLEEEETPAVEATPAVAEVPVEETLLAIIDGLTHEELVSVAEGIDELKPYMEDIKSKKVIAKMIAAKKIGIAAGKYVAKR